jgi:hypothetical protein
VHIKVREDNSLHPDSPYVLTIEERGFDSESLLTILSGQTNGHYTVNCNNFSAVQQLVDDWREKIQTAWKGLIEEEQAAQMAFPIIGTPGFMDFLAAAGLVHVEFLPEPEADGQWTAWGFVGLVDGPWPVVAFGKLFIPVQKVRKAMKTSHLPLGHPHLFEKLPPDIKLAATNKLQDFFAVGGNPWLDMNRLVQDYQLLCLLRSPQ